MRLWRRRKAETPWAGEVGVVGMRLQCEVCGVPTDAVQVESVRGSAVWVRVDPCGHVVSMEYDASA